VKTFIDTSAWAACFDRGDLDHAAARRTWKRLRRDPALLFTSDYVLDETITLLRRRAGYAAARRAGEALLDPRAVTLVNVEQATFRRAWELHAKYADHALSFTDCTTVALVQLGIADTVFTFDGDFRAVGCRTLPA
jgi:hypothetical protein